MPDSRTPREQEIDRKAFHSLEAIRQRQQDKLKADQEKMKFALRVSREKSEAQEERIRLSLRKKELLQEDSIEARMKERERVLQHRSEENELSREHRTQEAERAREQSEALTLARADAGLELENLRHQLRELEREPNFEDHKMREELAFLIRRQERLDANQIESYALERRITELRSLSRADIHKAVLLAVLEHIQSENTHERTIEEMKADTENELLKAEQAHGHRVKEMFSARYLDLIFSQMGGQLGGLSRTEVDDLVNQWEKEGDRLKK